MRVVLFAPFWLFDMTNLGIIASYDKKELMFGSPNLPEQSANIWPKPWNMQQSKDSKVTS
jgi:hypothetical protein